MRKLALAFLTLSLCAFHAQQASTAEIKVIASPAGKDALLELAPAFEKATGHKVTFVWAGSGAAEKRVLDGEGADLIMIATENIDKLIAANKVEAGSNTPFVKTGVGIALKTGLAKPDVSTPAALKKAVLDAKSVAYSQGPSGFHVAEVFKKLGLSDAVKDKLLITPSGVQIGEIVAKGEIDLGFQQVSELIHLPGIQFLGPLPAELQHYRVFAFGLHASSASRDAAKAFVTFVAPKRQSLLSRAAV